MNLARRPLVALLTAALGAVVLTGCGGSDPKTVDLSGTVVDPPFAIAADPLETTDGKPYSLTEDTTDPLTLVFFGYTRCPDICGLVMQSIAQGLTKLTEKQQEQVRVLFVTTDPAHDDDKTLDDYVSRYGKAFRGLTGDLPTIAKVGKSVGIFVDKGDQLAGGGYDPNSHGTYIIGVTDKHEAPIFWNGETSPVQFANDIKFLLTEKPDRLERAGG